MRREILWMLFLALTSCAMISGSNFSTNVAAWKGKSADSLLQTWGKPAISISRGQGAKTYVYLIKSKPIEIPSTSPNTSLIVGPKGKAIEGYIPSPPSQSGTLKCSATFEVNKEGVIVNTKSQGRYCLAP